MYAIRVNAEIHRNLTYGNTRRLRDNYGFWQLVWRQLRENSSIEAALIGRTYSGWSIQEDETLQVAQQAGVLPEVG